MLPATTAPSATRVQPHELYVVCCSTCGYTVDECGLIAASTLVMLHRLRCCPDAHVCVRPAARYWTPLGALVTVNTGPCLDRSRCEDA